MRRSDKLRINEVKNNFTDQLKSPSESRLQNLMEEFLELHRNKLGLSMDLSNENKAKQEAFVNRWNDNKVSDFYLTTENSWLFYEFRKLNESCEKNRNKFLNHNEL
jgi:hypothetical protein